MQNNRPYRKILTKRNFDSLLTCISKGEDVQRHRSWRRLRSTSMWQRPRTSLNASWYLDALSSICCNSEIVYFCIILFDQRTTHRECNLFHGKLYQWNITKTKQSENWRQLLPNLSVDTSNANWEVRDMIFPGSGKEGAIWLRCLSWSEFNATLYEFFF